MPPHQGVGGIDSDGNPQAGPAEDPGFESRHLHQEGNTMSTATDTTAVNAQRLATAVAGYSAQGWQVEAVIGTTATLSKTRRYSAVSHGFLTVITLGLWVPILVAAKLRSRPRRITISVDALGNTVVNNL